MLELKDNRIVDITSYVEEQREARQEAKKEFDNIIEKVINEVQIVIQAVRESNEYYEHERME